MGVFKAGGAGEQISTESCDSMLITYFPPRAKNCWYSIWKTAAHFGNT